jgi:hypothetical protein
MRRGHARFLFTLSVVLSRPSRSTGAFSLDTMAAPKADAEGDTMKAMNSFVPKLAIVLAALAMAGCEDPKEKWRAEGRDEAERDIAAGSLCLKSYGLPAPWRSKYHAMAKAKYGVEFDIVADCVVAEELLERVRGYNEAMNREISRRFGTDALDKLAEVARTEYEQEHPAGGASKP